MEELASKYEMNKWLISRNIISVFCVFNHFHANDVHECDFENRHFNVRGFYAFVLVYFTYNIQTITLSVVSLTCIASASRLLVYALEIFSLTDSLAYLLISYVSVAVRNTAIINRYFYTCSCVFACWLKRVETLNVWKPPRLFICCCWCASVSHTTALSTNDLLTGKTSLEVAPIILAQKKLTNGHL